MPRQNQNDQNQNQNRGRGKKQNQGQQPPEGGEAARRTSRRSRNT